MKWVFAWFIGAVPVGVITWIAVAYFGRNIKVADTLAPVATFVGFPMVLIGARLWWVRRQTRSTQWR